MNRTEKQIKKQTQNVTEVINKSHIVEPMWFKC